MGRVIERSNMFAVLDDNEDEAVDSMVAKAAATIIKPPHDDDQLRRPNSSSEPSNHHQNKKHQLSPSDSVNNDRRKASNGFQSRRYNGNDAGQYGNRRDINAIGSEKGNGSADHDRNLAKGRGNGAQQNSAKGRPDGNLKNHAKGYANGDENRFKGCSDNGNGSHVNGNGQEDVHAGGGDGEGWMPVSRKNKGQKTVPRSLTSASEETKDDADSISAVGTEGNGDVSTEVSEEEKRPKKERKVEVSAEEKQHREEKKLKDEEERRRRERCKERERERLEDAKKKTLKQYEEEMIANKKALGITKEKREVTVDKDLQSMQLITKLKEEEVFIKLSCEKDKAKKKDSADNKDVKIRKTLSISEFMTPNEEASKRQQTREKAESERQKAVMQHSNYGRRDSGRTDGDGQRSRRDGGGGQWDGRQRSGYASGNGDNSRSNGDRRDVSVRSVGVFSRDAGLVQRDRNEGRRDRHQGWRRGGGFRGGMNGSGSLESDPAVEQQRRPLPPPSIEDLSLFPTLK